MFQIIFSSLSSATIAKIKQDIQLDMITHIEAVGKSNNPLNFDCALFLSLDGKNIYRLRWHDYRIYFEQSEDNIIIHNLLQKNSMEDFLYRNDLVASKQFSLEEKKIDNSNLME